MSAVMQGDTNIVIDQEFRDYLSALRPEEYKALETSLLDTGCETPLQLWGDILIDGHNRYAICQEHGIEFETEQRAFADRDAVIDWMLVNQLGRRNLTPDDFTLFIGRLYNARKGTQGGDRKSKGQNDPLINHAADIAGTHGSSEKTVKRAGVKAEAIDTKASPELKEAVRNHEVSVGVAADVATLPKEQQDDIVAKGEKEILAAAKKIREEKSVERRAANKVVAAQKMEPTQGTYSTIVIDPPWNIQKIERDNRPNQTSELDYPTMSFDELVEFGEIVNGCAAEHAHLFMWTTQKWLPPAIKLLDAWDWKYVLSMVWHKNGGPQPFGLPQYNCEFCLYARRGSPEFSDTKAFNTCFQAPRREHSRKPDEFYELIQRVTHNGRIDIFSRENREGFAQYGNEADKFSEASTNG